jgi:hypothetical protein
MSKGLGIVAALLVLALPTTASAATRYAAPGGGMVPGCVQASPCSLENAIGGASPNDEVVVTSGSYTVNTTITTEAPLFIHGQDGAPRPRIVGAPGVTPFKSFVTQHLSYLTLEATDSATGVLFVPADDTVMERLEVVARGKDALGLRVGNNFTLTDSLIWAGESTGAAGLFLQGTDNGFPTLRNDTILAAGGESVGISVFVTGENASISILAINVIANAATDASAAVSPERTKSSAVIHFDHSDLDTTKGNVVSTYGQLAPPQFVATDPPSFLEAPGSPTIDAGANEPSNGPVDLTGNPRSLPAAPGCNGNSVAVTDIGAYEFVPATPVCPVPVPPDTKVTRFKLRKRTATFHFVASGGTGPVSFECKLDRKPFRLCSAPMVYKHLKPGGHVFNVRAMADGLVDSTAAERNFKLKRKHRHRRHSARH